MAEDNAGNYQTAFEKYKIALEYFGTHLKYEKNARARETITAKVGLSSLHDPLYNGIEVLQVGLFRLVSLSGHIIIRGHEPEADAVSLQFKEYLERAEYVKSLLDGQQPAEPSANGATGQKMKPGGGGGDKDVSATRHQAMPCRI